MVKELVQAGAKVDLKNKVCRYVTDYRVVMSLVNVSLCHWLSCRYVTGSRVMCFEV